MLLIKKAGMHTTIQGQPRGRFRHMGVPLSGAADPLSMGYANALVSNAHDENCLEITAGNFQAQFMKSCSFALAGATAELSLNGLSCAFYQTHKAEAGDVLTLGYPEEGLRAYLAISGGFKAECFLNSDSTYAPAALGGFQGRVLKLGDRLPFKKPNILAEYRDVPDHLRPFISDDVVLGVCTSDAIKQLDTVSKHAFLNQPYIATQRMNRMGIALNGTQLTIDSKGVQKSTPVFSGTIQCPKDGQPFLLMVDAQTTGGYPRIAHVIRAHRHRMGQIKPNARVSFRFYHKEQALDVLKTKTQMVRAYLPKFCF